METTPSHSDESSGRTGGSSTRPVERLFPFVMRARILLIGRETLRRSKSKLHFVLITEDISEHARAEVLEHFAHYPVVQHYTAADLERYFGIRGAKTIGFAKSGLAQSLYAELKQHRINQPLTPPPRGESLPPAPAVRRARANPLRDSPGNRETIKQAPSAKPTFNR